MEYLIMRGRLKLGKEDARPRLAALVQDVNRLLLGEEGARLTQRDLVIRYEGEVASSLEMRDVLHEMARCIRAGASVIVRRVRWETTLVLRRQATGRRVKRRV